MPLQLERYLHERQAWERFLILEVRITDDKDGRTHQNLKELLQSVTVTLESGWDSTANNLTTNACPPKANLWFPVTVSVSSLDQFHRQSFKAGSQIAPASETESSSIRGQVDRSLPSSRGLSTHPHRVVPLDRITLEHGIHSKIGKQRPTRPKARIEGLISVTPDIPINRRADVGPIAGKSASILTAKSQSVFSIPSTLLPNSSLDISYSKALDTLVTAISDVFSDKPIFGDRVISAIRHLPPADLDCLTARNSCTPHHGAKYEPVDGHEGSSSSSTVSTANASKQTESSKASSYLTPKSRSSLDRKDPNDDDDEEGGDARTPNSTQLPNSGHRPSTLDYACPAWLAWPHLFQQCGPRQAKTRFNQRNYLKSHLKEKHGNLYATPEERWADVEKIFDNAGHKRIRDNSWFQRELDDFYLPLWRLLIPREIPEPKSPFYPEPGDLLQQLTSQGAMLINLFLDTQAIEAVENGTASSYNSFQPTASDYSGAMARAFAVALKTVPGMEASVLQLSPERLRAMVPSINRAPSIPSLTIEGNQGAGSPASGSVIGVATGSSAEPIAPSNGVQPTPGLSPQMLKVPHFTMPIHWVKGPPLDDGNGDSLVRLNEVACASCRGPSGFTEFQMCRSCTQEFVNKNPR